MNARSDRRLVQLAGLTGELSGRRNGGVPLVLLHGLSFDRRMWWPVLEQLVRIEPERIVLALDLPGHGESSPWPSYDLESLADAVHAAVREAGLDAPVVVGHSLSGLMATLYAARHETAGVVNIDQTLDLGPFVALLHSLAPTLRADGFDRVWDMVWQSMHIELLPESGQQLLAVGAHPSPDSCWATGRRCSSVRRTTCWLNSTAS